MDEAELYGPFRRAHASLQAILDDYLASHTDIRALEAGCGSMSWVKLGDDVHVTGIDISQKQLDRNDDLHERFLGDIQTFPLPDSAFDVVLCWDVLEHLDDPVLALENLTSALKPGGLLILALPIPSSFHGMVTKLSPHWFHVLMYRALFWKGREDRAEMEPFPTFMRMSVTPGSLRKFADRPGLTMEWSRLYESNMQRTLRNKFRPFDWFVRSMALFRIASANRYDPRHGSAMYVIRKTG